MCVYWLIWIAQHECTKNAPHTNCHCLVITQRNIGMNAERILFEMKNDVAHDCFSSAKSAQGGIWKFSENLIWKSKFALDCCSKVSTPLLFCSFILSEFAYSLHFFSFTLRAVFAVAHFTIFVVFSSFTIFVLYSLLRKNERDPHTQLSSTINESRFHVNSTQKQRKKERRRRSRSKEKKEIIITATTTAAAAQSTHKNKEVCY